MWRTGPGPYTLVHIARQEGQQINAGQAVMILG